MIKEITLDLISREGLFSGKFEKEDIFNISSIRVGVPYLVISPSNVPLSSIVIRGTNQGRKYLGELDDFKYFIYNPTEGSSFKSHITEATKLVPAHKVSFNGRTMLKDFNVIEGNCPVGFILSKFPTLLNSEPIFNNSRKHDLRLGIDLISTGLTEITLNLYLKSNRGFYERRVSGSVHSEYNSDDTINIKSFFVTELFMQESYLESLKRSDVPHFAEQDFMDLVYKRIPVKVFRAEAYQPHSVVWYLVKTLGKSIVQNMYNNRDFTTEDLSSLLGENLKSIYKITEDARLDYNN